MVRFLYTSFALALVVFGCYVLLMLWPNHKRSSTLVVVNQGESVIAVGNRLAAEGVIASPRLLSLSMRLLGLDKHLVVGEFMLPPHASTFKVLRTIATESSVYLYKLTVPEGLTSRQVYDLLKNDPNLTGELQHVPAEGALMPNTYMFPKGESRAALVQRMQAAMSSYVAKLWQERTFAVDSPIKTPQQALVLASIIEKETSIPQERTLIASVFLNRLKAHMRLQSDPTVAYGLHLTSAKALTKEQLQTKTPYNTYRVNGLPPTPIGNPGPASLYAVFHPDQTDFLYFVATGCGGHKFATNLVEHNQNVQAWLKKERTLGENKCPQNPM